MIDFQNKKINNWLSFSQIHDHFRWFTMRIVKVKCNHRFQKKNFKLAIFFWLAYFYEWFNDFFLNTRVFLRTMKILFLLASFTSKWRFFLISRIFTRLTILFRLFAYFDEQFTRDKKFDECQLISQNSKREICCAKSSESSSLRLIKDFVLKMCDRHELNCAENEIVTNWMIAFFSTRWFCECEIYIVRHDENQI